jgi:predicted transposase YdaD
MEKSDLTPFDTVMKQLAGRDPQAWVSLISSFALESKQNTQWLKEKYPAMLEFLKESPLYQEIIEEGRQLGIEEGQERTQKRDLLRFVELRFPSLLVQAKQVIERRMSLQQLQALQDELYSAITIEEATAAIQNV